MKKSLLMFALLALVGCGGNGTAEMPDNQGQIDANKARIELIEAKNEVQDLRLDALEVEVANLKDRMDEAELDIIDNTDLIVELTDDLDDELDDLRSDMYYYVNQLRRADRNNRYFLLYKISQLNASLHYHVNQLEDADEDLLDEINSVSSRLSYLNGRFNAFKNATNTKFFLLGLSISYLASQIDSRLDDLENDVEVNSQAISDIQSSISTLQQEMSTAQSDVASLQSQINNVESKLVSVVYPCGENNSEEVLLKTQDGLVAYFQSSSEKTITFSDSITVNEYTISGHYDKYCSDRRADGGIFGNQECREYSYRFIPGQTIPQQVYNVGDSATITTIDKAYLDVLGDGNYQTTDGHSCNFSIVNGEVQ